MPSTPEELLKRLAATPEYTYPLVLLTEIRDRLPEMIPALLTVLQDARQFPDDFSDRTSAWMQPMFAAYFLAEAREKAAYRPLITLLNLPSDDVDVLFGEMITGDMGRILASVFDGDEQPLRDLVENPEVPEYVRACCGLGPYLCLLHNQLLTAEAVSGYFTELMRGTACRPKPGRLEQPRIPLRRFGLRPPHPRYPSRLPRRLVRPHVRS